MFFKRPGSPPSGGPTIQPLIAETFLSSIMPRQRYQHWHVANARAALTFPSGSPSLRQWLTQQRTGLFAIIAEPLTPFGGGAYSEHRLRDAGFCAIRIQNSDGAEAKARAHRPAPQAIVSTKAFLYLLWRLPGRGGLVPLDAAKTCADLAAKALRGENIGYRFPLPGTMHDGALATPLLADPAGLSMLTAFEPSKEEEDVRPLGAVERKDTPWVWRGVFPAGFALLGGEAGLRKTQAAISLGACITSEGYWPASRTRAAPGCAMIFASEDEVASVIKNRVLAAIAMYVDELIERGAARRSERGALTEQSEHRWYASNAALKLPDDHHKIERAAASMKKQTGLPVLMTIFDPLARYYANQHREGVRAALDPLKDWALSEGGVVIGIRHPNKERNETNIQSMISGSSAEMETARSTYFFFHAPTDGHAWMLWAKGNYHAPREKAGFETTVEDWTTPEGFATSRVRWLDNRIELTANAYLDGQTPRLAPPGGRNGGGASGGGPRLLLTGAKDKVDAEEWVRRVLAGGARIRTNVLEELAASKGIDRNKLYRLRHAGVLDTYPSPDGSREKLWGLRI